MLTKTLITGEGVGLSGELLMARLIGLNGQPATQASFSSISYTVSDLTAGTTGSSVSVPLTSVSNSLVTTDPRWRQDSAAFPGEDGFVGYNWILEVPASSFPVSVLDPTKQNPIPVVKQYHIDVVFNVAGGQPFRARYEFPGLAVYA